ncbi:MAG TPA: neutral zinc metallopeptidase [Ilumatobacteraceae bacterium]|nr:neutral zinc metallopeptidase [Ilumatobacteraceae bacterium]
MTRIRSGNSSMIDDRRGSGIGSGGLGGLGGLSFPIKAGGGMLGIIVMLASLLLPRLLNGGQSAASVPQQESKAGDVADGTCSSDLEQVVCGATVDVQTFWQANLQRFYGVDYEVTKTVFFTDATNTGCGQASSQTGPFYCPIDHLVYIDLGFMQALEKEFVGTSTDLAEQYIVAHEYGHHIQNLVGINEQVQQAQQNDPGRANQYSVAMELQADCFAGIWVGDAASRGLLDSPDEINEALAAAAGVGDDRIQEKTQGRIDKEAWTHGSAEQRQTWFTRGYNSGDPKQCDTFSEVL